MVLLFLLQKPSLPVNGVIAFLSGFVFWGRWGRGGTLDPTRSNTTVSRFPNTASKVICLLNDNNLLIQDSNLCSINSSSARNSQCRQDKGDKTLVEIQEGPTTQKVRFFFCTEDMVPCVRVSLFPFLTLEVQIGAACFPINALHRIPFKQSI